MPLVRTPRPQQVLLVHIEINMYDIIAHSRLRKLIYKFIRKKKQTHSVIRILEMKLKEIFVYGST
jgi:hypothetical protein